MHYCYPRNEEKMIQEAWETRGQRAQTTCCRQALRSQQTASRTCPLQDGIRRALLMPCRFQGCEDIIGTPTLRSVKVVDLSQHPKNQKRDLKTAPSDSAANVVDAKPRKSRNVGSVFQQRCSLRSFLNDRRLGGRFLGSVLFPTAEQSPLSRAQLPLPNRNHFSAACISHLVP
jgi:hypothetical protein